MIKKFFIIVLSLIIAFSCISCSSDSSSDGKVEVWTAYGTEKILQQEDYNARYNDKTLKIAAFINEREAGQIIISVGKEDMRNVDEYTLTLNDLSDGKGNTLPKSAWQIFNQKYTYVPVITENYLSGLSIGWYPDALLPMDTAIEYNENSIKWEEVNVASQKMGYDNSSLTTLNQGIWLEVNVPKGTAAGTYSGNFILNIDGEDVEVPVIVEVYGYTLGDYTHTKSTIGIQARDIARAELDNSLEMYTAYEEMLLDHRLNPYSVVSAGDEMTNDVTVDEETFETFMQQAVDAAMDGRWTSFNVPYSRTQIQAFYVLKDTGSDGGSPSDLINVYTKDESGKVDFTVVRNADGTLADVENVTYIDKDGQVKQAITREVDSMISVDFAKYSKIIYAYAERGLEESIKNLTNDSITEPVDIMKLAASYFMMYDEFNNQGLEVYAYASYCQEKAYWVNQELADKIENELGQNLTVEQKNAFKSKYGISFEDYKIKIANECRNIRNKVVGSYDENFLATHGVYVPQIRFLNDDKQISTYENYDRNSYGNTDEDMELWTYICNHPNTPYTTLHTDDFLISSRMYGWLMYEANIAGHLSWSAVYNIHGVLEADGYTTRPTQMLDYYYDAHRWSTTSGEGYLFYPGREYGIYGPVASIRLKSLSDGIEDYDLLYELEEVYKLRGVSGDSFDNIYKLFYAKLHNGTKVNYSDSLLSDFRDARATLAELLVNAYSHGVIVEDYKAYNDKGLVTVSAPKGMTLDCNGLNPSSTTECVDKDGNDFVRYTFIIDLTGSNNQIKINCKQNGESISSISLQAGGKVNQILGEELESYIFTSTSGDLNDSIELNSSLYFSHEVEGINGLEVIDEKVTTINYKGVDANDEDALPYQRALIKVSSKNFNETTNSVKLTIYYDSDSPLEIQLLYNTTSKRVLDILDTVELKKGWNEITFYGASLKFSEDNEDDCVNFLGLNVQTTDACSISLGKITWEVK